MTDCYSVREPSLSVFTNVRRLGRRTRRPDRMMERLRGHHGALHAVLLEAFLDLADNLILPVSKQGVCRDDVRIVSTPVPHAHSGVPFDDLLESKRRSNGRMKNRLAFVGRSPLGAGDEIPAPNLRRICASTRLCQS